FMVTIPEGLTVWEIAVIISNNTDIDSASFHNRACDTAYTMENYNLEGLEGFLFPETYRFWYQIELDEIIEIMVDEYRRQTERLNFDDAPNNLSEKEIVILASIIEAEARDGSELGKISSVYNNRLSKKMRLQADPTVIYALGGLDRPLWFRDLEYDSPYNTYKYRGLPPGPINSPGLAAIKAALNPETTDFLYFVADGTGKHIFSKTLREHNRARSRIKKSNRK
ncbi:MAG TPA: endolytic transglycosylase MltG, partial [candidate division Zixibacteria bacterium]|nr:endolytic transglycosylase MltG [candidate division Zixibacteria bacterium]